MGEGRNGEDGMSREGDCFPCASIMESPYNNAIMHLTFKRLAIFLVVLMILATAAIAWFWQYAYTPQGRARTVLCELRRETTGLRAWMISHGVIKREFYLEAAYEKVKLARAPQRGCVIHYADLVGARFFEFGPNIEPVLVEALKDENADIRIGAALAMAKFKDQRAVPILLSAVQEPFVFPEAAAGALMQLGRQEGFDFLVKGMRNPHYPDKWVLAMELGNQGDRRAVEPLLAMLSNKSGDEYFRKEAALALGKLGETKAIPAIRNLLKDPDDQVRRAAADALRQLGVNENSARKK